jgi:hypothetical protein
MRRLKFFGVLCVPSVVAGKILTPVASISVDKRWLFSSKINLSNAQPIEVTPKSKPKVMRETVIVKSPWEKKIYDLKKGLEKYNIFPVYQIRESLFSITSFRRITGNGKPSPRESPGFYFVSDSLKISFS